MTTQAAAAASVPQTAPRRASGPGRMAAHCLTNHSRSQLHRFLSIAPEERTAPSGAVSTGLESLPAIGFTLAFRFRVSSRRHCTRLLRAQTAQLDHADDREVAGGIKGDEEIRNSEWHGDQSRQAGLQSESSGNIRQNGHGCQFQTNLFRRLASLPAWPLR